MTVIHCAMTTILGPTMKTPTFDARKWVPDPKLSAMYKARDPVKRPTIDLPIVAIFDHTDGKIPVQIIDEPPLTAPDILVLVEYGRSNILRFEAIRSREDIGPLWKAGLEQALKIINGVSTIPTPHYGASFYHVEEPSERDLKESREEVVDLFKRSSRSLINDWIIVPCDDCRNINDDFCSSCETIRAFKITFFYRSTDLSPRVWAFMTNYFIELLDEHVRTFVVWASSENSRRLLASKTPGGKDDCLRVVDPKRGSEANLIITIPQECLGDLSEAILK